MRRYVFPKNTPTQYFQKTIIEDKWFSAELHGSGKIQRCLVVSKSASWDTWQQIKKSSCCEPL